MSSYFIVWVLVTVTWSSAAMTSYSPPIESEEACLEFQKEVKKVNGDAIIRSKCVQLKYPRMAR